MSFRERIAKLSPAKLQLLAAQQQERIARLEARAREPIAVIGMSCRFPGGADSIEAYWKLLEDGVDAIREVPPDRWDVDALYDPDPDAPGKVATRWGGFLDDVDRFDPAFFGITPREAASMDPQQRLLLEVAWEALEDARQAPDRLAGHPTGVFVGLCNLDHLRVVEAAGPEYNDMYLSTGNAGSVASGRISYVLGLQGPSLTVDTACSSSLVSTALAVRSLRMGECRQALAGGVNLTLTPETTITLSRAAMMAPDGRCKAFDARADGFVRSEGCGLVVLKRLSDALADGDPIRAVLRGAAINQDGRSNGITAPNGPSQVAVIRAALQDAGLKPDAIDYVETHGTGTSLGDPIEVQALGRVLGEGRPDDRPVLLGSAKTNLGHCESAAGIAGLIKLVLMVERGRIPPHLHFQTPSPHIDWDRLPVRVPAAGEDWPARGPRRGAVSSFGFSGTNAHIVVEQAPEPEPPSAETQERGDVAERTAHPLVLAARSDEALRATAARWAELLEREDAPALADVAWSTRVSRARGERRLGLCAADASEAARLLRAWHAGEEPEDVVAARVPPVRAANVLAFGFTGHGAQETGMGRALFDAQPAYRAAMEECDALLRPRIGTSILDVIDPSDPDDDSIHRMELAQPALFALEYALYRMWESWGVAPAIVFGHSLGEYVAAHVAGVFGLEDALRLVAARSALMGKCTDGAMGSTIASPERVERAIERCGGAVSIAAVNGPESVVVSGAAPDVERVLETLERDGAKVKRLAIATAAHSPLMEPYQERFAETAQAVSYAEPDRILISNVTGRRVEPGEVSRPEYWVDHMRRAVRFGDGVGAALDAGATLFLELGPSSTLAAMGRLCDPERGVWLATLRSGEDPWRRVGGALAALDAHGVPVDWDAFDAPYARRRVALPLSPWVRARHWVGGAGARAGTPPSGEHPLLGPAVASPAFDGVVFTRRFSRAWPPFVEDHRVHGHAIVPSPVFAEMALEAARRAAGREAAALEGLEILEALELPDDGEREVQLVLDPERDGRRAFEIHSRVADAANAAWTLHVRGRLDIGDRAAEAAPPPALDRAVVRERCATTVEGEAFYDEIRRIGLDFGPRFRGVRRVHRRDGEALAELTLPEELQAESARYRIHPALLDACLHALGAPLPETDEPASYLLVGFDRLIVRRRAPDELLAHVVLPDPAAQPGETFAGDVRIHTRTGEPVAELTGLCLKRVTPQALRRLLRPAGRDWFHEVVWKSAGPTRAGEGAGLPVPPAADGLDVGAAIPRDAARALDGYAALAERLDTAAADWAARALAALDVGGPGTEEEWAACAGVVERHRPLFGRLLEILEAVGRVRRDGDRRFGEDLAADDPATGLDALREANPEFVAEIDLLRVCGPELAGVLRGSVDPLSLLFPEGSSARVEPLYHEAPWARAYNAAAAEALAAWVGTRRAPLRVLEIGAGSGGTTAALLPRLDPASTEYVYTDVSPAFFDRARERFGEFAFVDYRALDVEDPEAVARLAAEPFDLVVAANVLHATADLDATLARVRSLLRPGGGLLLVEGVRPRAWADLTFGLTEGWWRFAAPAAGGGPGDGRTYALIDADEWKVRLKRSGFPDARALDLPADRAAGQSVLLARADQAAAGGARRDAVVLGSGALAEALARRLAADGCAARSFSDVAAALDAGALDAPCRLIDVRPVDASAVEAPAAGAGTSSVPDTPGRARAESRSFLELIRAATASKSRVEAIWVATRGAQAAGGASPLPGAAAVWGLGRTAALEHPDLWGGLIDLDPRPAAAVSAEREAEQILGSIADRGEDQQAWREGTRLRARLVRREPVDPAPPPVDPAAAYLVTGGLGGLGLHVARRLAEAGARHLVLLGRTGVPSPERAAEDPEARRRRDGVASVEALGARVEVIAADLADPGAMESLFARFGDDLPPLRGIVHAAVAMSDAPLREMDDATLEGMFRAKVDGARVLHRASLELDPPLDWFAFFSSTTALLGVAGLGHYAAANQYLDALAAMRRAQGAPAVSIAWGTWEEMRVADAAEQERFAAFGLRPLPVDAALDRLGGLLAPDAPVHVAVADVDWATLRSAYEARRARPLLAELGRPEPESAAAAGEPPGAANPLFERLRETAPSRRHDVLVEHVRGEVARVLRSDAPQAIDERQGLFEIGMDSLMAAELAKRLSTAADRKLPATLGFNYPTIADLADYLLEEVFTPQALEAAGGSAAAPSSGGSGAAGLQRAWAGAAPGARPAEVERAVQAHVAAVLRSAPGQTVDVDQGLFELGLDSLMAVELKTRLERDSGLLLPSTLVFNYPTVRDLVRFLDERFGDTVAAEAAEAAEVAPSETAPEGEATGSLDDLSEEELAERLRRKLSRFGSS